MFNINNTLDHPYLTRLNFLSLIPGYTTIGVMRIITLTASIFGDQQEAERLREHADAMWASRVGRILNSASRLITPLPLLSIAVNIPQDRVLFRDEEIEMAEVMRRRLQQNQSLDLSLIEKLENSSFKGLKANGVCLGSSLTFLKSVLANNCTKEKELIALAEPFSEGCGKEGAALQKIADLLMNYFSKEKQTLFEEYLKTTEQRVTILSNANPELGREIEKEYQELKDRIFSTIQSPHEYGLLNSLASLLGMQITKPGKVSSDFRSFDTARNTRQSFDDLPNGSYLLKFLDQPGQSYHVIAYLKFNFRSYLFDPMKGLLRCPSRLPSEDLQKLLKIHPGNQEADEENCHQLQIFGVQFTQ